MNPTGILVLNKPSGQTSHDCVVRVRRLFKTKKVGHTGTLDPAVTGVLPICLGRATKVAKYMSDYAKAYEGEVTIGVSTTTEDQCGEIVERKAVHQAWSEAEVKKLLASFQGKLTQMPPMFSAVKVRGRRLYEYARAGISVERPVREVTIHKLELVSPISFREGLSSFRFRVECSKGTYVRTLAVDLGKALGFPAHMSALRRTASGPFQLKQCITFDQLEELSLFDRYQLLQPFEQAIAHLPAYQVNEATEARVKHGAVLPNKTFDENRFTIYNEKGSCLAVYRQHPTKSVYKRRR